MRVKHVAVITGTAIALLSIMLFLMLVTQTGMRLIIAFSTKYIIKNTTYGEVSGRLTGSVSITDITHTAEGYSLHCSTASLKLHLLPLLVKKLSVKYLTLESFSIHESTGTKSLRIEKITCKPLTADRESIKSAVSWQNMDVYDDGESLLRSRTGTIAVSGPYSAYVIEGEASVAGHLTAEGTVKLTAGGNYYDITVQTLSAGILNGTVQADGSLSFLPYVKWDFTLTGTHIDPALLVKGYTGDLALSARTTGTVKEQPLWFVQVAGLEGTLNEKKVSASGNISKKKEDRYEIKTELNAGSFKANIAGSRGSAWDISWQFSADEIHDLLPQAAGKVYGYGSLKGPPDNPYVEAELNGTDMTARAMGPLQLSVRLTGRQRNHTMHTAVVSAGTTAALGYTGSYKDTVLNGMITELMISTGTAGAWHLEKEAPFAIGPDYARLEQVTVSHNSAQVSLAARVQKNKSWDITAEMRDIPLGMLNSFLPHHVRVRGQVNGSISGSKLNNDVSFTGMLTTTPGEITYLSAVPSYVSFDKSIVAVSLKDSILSVMADLHIEDNSTVNFNGTISSFSMPLKNQPFTARLDADINTLTFLPVFFPRIADPTGSMHISLRSSGTLNDPLIEGTAELSADRTLVPAAGITLTDIELKTAIENHNTVTLHGSAHSGDGSLNISGTAPVRFDSFPAAEFEISGTDFQLLNIPQYRVSISPSLTVSIMDSSVHTDGSIILPSADIRMEKHRTARITVPEDVEIKGAQIIEEAKLVPLKNTTIGRVTIESDRIKFEGYGLTAVLKGNLVVKKKKDDIFNVAGELTVLEGTYQVYGQRFEITKGQLIFDGDPANPLIRLEATRTVGSITAGLRLTGQIKNPNLTLFSIPPMTQAEILSYLFLGRPLHEAGSEGGTFILSAGAALNLAQKNILTRQIQPLLESQDIELSVKGTAEGDYLIISKSVSRKLRVSYGITPFETGNTFQVQYYFNPKLMLQAESGLFSGMDLIYTIEYEKTKQGPIKDIQDIVK